MATSCPTPSLALSMATPSDMPALTSIWYAAFADPFIYRIFPDTPAGHAWWTATNTADLLHKPTARYLTVTDTATDQVVGYAKWAVPTPDGGTEDFVHARFPPLPEGSDEAAAVAFFGNMARERARYMAGRPHMYLDMIAVLPEYQGMGAGKLLMNWGLELADAQGLETFLDASAAGEPMYRRFGFEGKEPFVVPGETFSVTSYIRQPKAKSG